MINGFHWGDEMIIEDEPFKHVTVDSGEKWIIMVQDADSVMISRKQAAQLIEVLQGWVDGGEVE